MSRTLLLVVTAACLVAGCASGAPEKKKAVPEPEFGSSVRNMVRAQTFNPQAGKGTTEAPAGMDGDKAAAAVKAYRAEKPASGAQPAQQLIITPGQ